MFFLLLRKGIRFVGGWVLRDSFEEDAGISHRGWSGSGLLGCDGRTLAPQVVKVDGKNGEHNEREDDADVSWHGTGLCLYTTRFVVSVK